MLQLYWKTYRQRKRKGKVQLIDRCLEDLLTLTICVFACVEIKGWKKQTKHRIKNMKYAQILILLMQIYFIWFPWSRFFHFHLMQNYLFYIFIYKHIILILLAIHYFWQSASINLEDEITQNHSTVIWLTNPLMNTRCIHLYVGEVMEAGITASYIFILLSCGGEESLKRDGQHNPGTPVRLALTALTNRMTHTPPSYANSHPHIFIHTCAHTQSCWVRKKSFFAERCKEYCQGGQWRQWAWILKIDSKTKGAPIRQKRGHREAEAEGNQEKRGHVLSWQKADDENIFHWTF